MATFKKVDTGKGFTVNECLIGMKKDSNGFPIGFFSVRDKLFRVQISPSNKDGVESWVRITACKKKPSSDVAPF